MMPRFVFVARTVAYVALVIIAGLAVSVIFAGIIRAFKISGVYALSNAGAGGWLFVFMIMPWMPIFLALVISFLAVYLFRKYPAGWHMPVILVFSAVLVASVLTGYFISPHSWQDNMWGRLENTPARNFSPMRRLRMMGPSASGTITSFYPSYLIVKNLQGKEFKVEISSSTRVIPSKDIMEGDFVFVAGPISEDFYIYARKIIKMPSDWDGGVDFAPPIRGGIRVR